MRASATTFLKYEQLPDVRCIPQTRVTYVQQIDLKGFIPALVMNSKTVQTLEYLSTMRQKFDKSLEIDAGRRAAIVQFIELEEASGAPEALSKFEALVHERKGCERPSSIFGTADAMVKV